MNRCEEFQKSLSEFIDGEKTAEEAATALVHVGNCHQCRTFLSSVLMLRPAAAHLFSVKVSSELDDRIHKISEKIRTRRTTV